MGLSFRLSVFQRKRMKRRRRQEMEIPMDVVMEEILTRLPPKSLMRFKCLSKLFSSIITSPYFNNRYLTFPSPRLYMCLVDFTSYRNYVILSLAPDATSSSSFVVDHDLTIPRRGGYISQILGGFMCYAHWKRLRICNPATRQLVILPAIRSNITHRKKVKTIFFFFFGHDPVNHQYKAICSIAPNINTMPEHWVFVLAAAGGASWKRAAPTPPDFRPHLPDERGGVCINGYIYYLACIDTLNYVLVSFHVRSEEFNMIQVPRGDGDDEMPGRLMYLNLIEYDGKLTLLDRTNLGDKGMLNLWALDQDSKWSQKTLLLKPSQLHLVNNIAFRVKGTQNGQILLIPLKFHSPYHILCYDLQSNDMRKIEIKGIPDHWFRMDKTMMRFDFMFMDQSESVVHLET